MKKILINALIISLFACLNSHAMQSGVITKENQSYEVLKLAQYVSDEVGRYIHFSTNKGDEGATFNRDFWFNAMRARNPKADKGLRKRLRETVQLDFYDNEQEPALKLRKIEDIKGLEGKTFEEASSYFWMMSILPRKTKHKDGSPALRLEEIERRAKNAILFGTGNCEEMASLAFIFLLEYPAKGLPYLAQFHGNLLIQLVSLKPPAEHYFVVISDEFSNHVVLDPWIGEIFLLNDENARNNSKWFSYSKNYEHRIEFTAKIGSGHSLRWNTHRHTRDQPVLLSDWQPYQMFVSTKKYSLNERFERAYIRRMTRNGLPHDMEELEILQKIAFKHPELISVKMQNYLTQISEIDKLLAPYVNNDVIVQVRIE